MEISVIQSKIIEIRGQKVILDFEIADLYGVDTKVLNQAVKRNPDRFPIGFMFRLSSEEWTFQRSQFVTFEKWKGKYLKYLPNAFTEQGVAMLASILKSEKAIKMNIAIVRAFIAMREIAFHYKAMAESISEIRLRVGEHDTQLNAIYEAIENMMEERVQQQSWKDRERIGFKK